ncbi:MAG: hypothetical protein E3K38_03660 [Candidatus Kuenenia stuttgartiensis]|nr:hypothetical protein [Candidatus Kuenenia stuttgartiensis]
MAVRIKASFCREITTALRHQSPISNLRSPIPSHQSAICRLPTVDCRLPIADCIWRISLSVSQESYKVLICKQCT